MSTSCPPDIIYMISVLRPSPWESMNDLCQPQFVALTVTPAVMFNFHVALSITAEQDPIAVETLRHGVSLREHIVSTIVAGGREVRT